jgi:hypothetical protein
MSNDREVWLLEAYEDPYIAPHTIGVFESIEALVVAVNEEYTEADIEWGDNRVILTFEIKSLFSDVIVRRDKIRLDFRPFPVGEIFG